MSQDLVASFKSKHPDLFSYQVATEIHPHDHFMARTVLWLFPHSVTPNKVTLFRVVTTPIVFFLVLFQYYQIGFLAFLFVAFTDAIDGSLARTRDQITKFGMMFDPVADKLLVGSLVFLLVFRIHYWLAMAVLGIEMILILSGLVAKIKFKTVLMANRWGKIKMLLQVVALGLTMFAFLVEAPGLLTIAAWIFGIAIGFAIVSLFAHGI